MDAHGFGRKKISSADLNKVRGDLDDAETALEAASGTEEDAAFREQVLKAVAALHGAVRRLTDEHDRREEAPRQPT